MGLPGNWREIMSRFRFFTILMIAAAAAGLSGCSISANKDSHGGDKDVDIRTPMGSISVHKGAMDVKDTGLSAYPGATINKDTDSEGGANVNVSSSFFGVKVVALKFRSDDAPDKVLSFYRKDMSKYGKVLDCGGGFSMSFHRHDKDGEVTCEDRTGHHEYTQELKVGTENNQRIVAVKPS